MINKEEKEMLKRLYGFDLDKPSIVLLKKEEKEMNKFSVEFFKEEILNCLELLKRNADYGMEGIDDAKNNNSYAYTIIKMFIEAVFQEVK